MSEPRFDVVYGPGPSDVKLEQYKDKDDAPPYALYFSVARLEVAAFYRDLARRWEELTLEGWQAKGGP